MKSPISRLAGGIATCLALAIVVVFVGTRLVINAASTQSASTRQAASTLPSGVCPLATDGLPVAQATSMQAKLVGFDVALSSDPNFPFKGGAATTSSRVQSPIRVANYFWVVAAAGNFEMNFMRPPQAGPNVGSFKYMVFYIPADRCDMPGGYATQGLGVWPSWFDSMQALSATTLK